MSIEKVNRRHKMNEIVNKFLLAGDKFMPEVLVDHSLKIKRE